MARVRILKAAEQHTIYVSNTSAHAHVPIDGDFHEIHDDLVPVLADSGVEFETENADATGGDAAAGGAEALGGSAAPLTSKPKAKAKAKAKPKAKK